MHSIALDAAGPGAEKLTIDIAWFGAAYPRRVLLHSSGLHGVEGFAGSAIQLRILKEPPSLPEEAALVVVHTLNPYGMAHLRRVNENNVDLNRNFVTIEDKRDAARLEEVLPVYRRFDSFLNPQSPPARDLYRLKALYLILRYGMPLLKQALVGGQYWFPRGLFYGGKLLNKSPDHIESEREPGAREYQAFVRERLAGAEKVIAVDVHTGLGKFAYDTLLVDKEHDKLRAMFGERIAPMNPDKSVAYDAWGTAGGMVSRVLPGADVLFVTQEFGTYSGPTVLHALREENRWRHYGAGTLDHPTKRILKKTFCPDDESWRDAVLSRGMELVQQCVSHLK